MTNYRTKSKPQVPIGQLMVVGFVGTRMTSRLNSLLAHLQPAGVVLFARNIKTAKQTWELLQECRQCVNSPLFTCVDLEGGSVDRFRDVLGPTPSAADVFATGDPKLFRKQGRLTGENCHALGFNVDFAPVLDLAFEKSREVLGERAASANPRHVVKYAREFLAGLRAAGVMGCGKHFPGLGEGRLDSHHKLPVINKTLYKMWAEDLFPYRALRAQLPMTMISHAAYPLITKTRSPASLSKLWITDVLRKKIGYTNLIVSDDMEMGGALSASPVGETAVEFIRAGGDLCLVCHREDRVLEAYQALLAETARDGAFAQRAREALNRVAAFKRKWSKIARMANSPSSAAVEKLSCKLWEFGEQVRLENLARAERERSGARSRP